MQEDILFDRVHQALDVKPPAGAYERFRAELIKQPARSPRWPAANERWRKMGFRFAAGLAIIAIAAAIAAALAATHNTTGGVSPAGQPRSVEAYRAMVVADLRVGAGTWPNPCDPTHQSGCMANLEMAIPAEEKLLRDLGSALPPARFAIFDAELRHHAQVDLAAMKSLRAALQAHDDAAFIRAFLVGLYGGEWIGTVEPGFEFSRQVDAATYTGSVLTQKQAIDSCGACAQRERIQPGQCSFTVPSTCVELFDGMASKLANFEGALLQYAAPASLAAKDLRLQRDVQRADEILLAMRASFGTGDQAAFFSGAASLAPVFAQIDLDAAAITS